MRTLSRHRYDFDSRLPAVAINNQRHGAPCLSAQIRFQVSCLFELPSINGNDAIVGLESGLAGRAIGYDGNHANSLLAYCGGPELGSDGVFVCRLLRLLTRLSLGRLLNGLLGRLLTSYLTITRSLTGRAAGCVLC